VSLSSLDGKARLAERCKPLLAQIPDGAFGDLMRQRLTELTGVGARASTPETHVPVQRARSSPSTPTQRRSLVRSAIALLLQQPSLALSLEPPYRFAALALPGIDLLVDMLAAVKERPAITTGGMLERFGDREEAAALQKLAMEPNLYEHGEAEPEFRGILRMLELQYLEQRIAQLNRELTERGLASLSDAEKLELRELPLQANALKRELSPTA
jgi:DNA primase